MPAPTYIISKVADPFFAVFIGLSAAATRINREEKEKGRTTSQTWVAGRRHVIHSHCIHLSSYSASALSHWHTPLTHIDHRRLGLSQKA